jgi:hypothetical protein
MHAHTKTIKHNKESYAQDLFHTATPSIAASERDLFSHGSIIYGNIIQVLLPMHTKNGAI